MVGDFGPKGNAGVPGDDNDVVGATGSTGPDGVSPQGPTGFIGATGSDDNFGDAGPTGPGDLVGPQGGVGDPGDPLKLAIVETTAGPRTLYCIESPNVWFEDVMQVAFVGKEKAFPVGPVFVEVCEPETLFVAACCPDQPIDFSVALSDSTIRFETSSIGAFNFVVTIRGQRKGFVSRFQKRTESERLANNRFWASV